MLALIAPGRPARAITIVSSSLLAALAGAPAARAEEPVPLDERDFLQRFERTEPGFASLAARVDASRAEVTDARLLPNPSIAADREEIFVGGEGTPENILRLSVPINLSGRRSRRVRAAEAGLTAAQAESALGRQLMILDALEIYYDAAYARERAKTLHDGRDDLAKLVEVVRSRRSAGDVSGYDLDRLELELGDYDDAIADAEIELALARRRLAVLVGEPNRLFEASGSLDLATATGVPAGQASVSRRGDVRAARLRVTQAEAELSAARRAWVPSLLLTGGLKTADVGTETASGYVVGLSLELPLFDNGQAERARSAAKKRARQAEARTVERSATLAVATSRDELARRQSQAAGYRDTQVKRLPDLLRRALTSYREGDRPIFELLDAYRTARDVQLRHLEIRRLVRKADIALRRAEGHR
jgi:cobalt-zinc-cadmium efflux system outer membrane protein